MAVLHGTLAGHKTLLTTLDTWLTGTVGWTNLRSVTSGDYEMIWRLPGLTGTDYSYAGIKTYESIPADYYNWKVNGWTGYVPGNSFELQPGGCTAGPTSVTKVELGIPLTSLTMEYWFYANARTCIGFIKVQNQYESFIIQKFDQNGSPNQYPYPLFIGGMLTTASATRYSDNTQVSWFKGARQNAQMRFTNGEWRNPQILPYSGPGVKYLRNTGTSTGSPSGYYGLKRLVLSENTAQYVNNYGTLDGVYSVSEYQAAVEDTLLVDGITYTIFPNLNRNGNRDFIAMRTS